MSTRKTQIDGRAWRRYKRMVALNCKPPKERSGARKKHKGKRRQG